MPTIERELLRRRDGKIEGARVGPVAVTLFRQGSGAPLVDGASVRLAHDDGECGFNEHFGGVAFRCPSSDRTMAVVVLNRQVPNPARWRPRFLVARVRWVLAGRPVSPPMTPSGHDFESPR